MARSPEKFTVWSKDDCPYCQKIEYVMDALRCNWELKKLGTDFTREEFTEKFGNDATFPRVYIGEELLGGCGDAIWWMKERDGYFPAR